MSSYAPQAIGSESISTAWVRVVKRLMSVPKGNIGPLVVTIGGLHDGVIAEDRRVRDSLDTALQDLSAKGKRLYATRTTASLIFPQEFWQRKKWRNRSKFFNEYLGRLYPRQRALNRLNGRGTYFQRMIDYTGLKGAKTAEHRRVNQLEHIISIWGRARSNGRRPRRSAMQVACFDPAKDSTGACLSAFPCLQQVAFGFDSDNRDSITLTAFYPSEYIISRAYGNYLGLCRLGIFMAKEMRTRLDRISVVVGTPHLDVPKKQVARLLESLPETVVSD